MRFHTSLTYDQVRSVERPSGVYWHHVREYGSRSRLRAFEIVLEGNSCYGGQWGDRDYKAATWDEWGVVLGRLFALDPNARVAKVYEGAEHYHHVTGDRFHPFNLPARLCPRHRWMGWDRRYPNQSWCTKCDAVRRWDWRADPEPRDDTASQHVTPEPERNERGLTAEGERAWQGVQPTHPLPAPDPELGKYASHGAYEQDLLRNPVDLLDRIDELIKEG